MILQQQQKLFKIFGVLFEVPLLIKHWQCPTEKNLCLEKKRAKFARSHPKETYID